MEPESSIGAARNDHPVRFPDCVCQKCGSIFRDHMEIFPGPALCPTRQAVGE